MKKRKVKKWPFIVLLLLIGLIFGSLYMFREYFEKGKDDNNPDILEKEEPKEKEYKTTFTLGGNVLINNYMWYDTTSNEGYEFKSVFEDLNDIMKKSNVNFYFQQSMVGGKELGLSMNYTYNSPDEIVKSLKELGFNTMSLASYHSYDKGIAGIQNAVKQAKANEFVYSGVNDTEENRNTNNIITKNGIKIALLSYTMGTDTAVANPFAVNIYGDDLVKNDVDKIKEEADIIMVSIDWGNNSNQEVSQEQKRIATYLSSLGVNIVVGNTGFTIQPIEIIGETIVCYSLGNLLSGHIAVDSRISAMVDFELKISELNNNRKVTFDNIKVLLTYAYNMNNTGYKVIPFTKLSNELLNYKSYYDKYNTLLSNKENNISLYTIGD